MTPAQKELIFKLRMEGQGYKSIAKVLSVTEDAVKGHCKRQHLSGPAEIVTINSKAVKRNSGLCLECSKPIRHNKHGRPRKFCSDACRYTWWNKNPDRGSESEEATYHYTCTHCGKRFAAYGDKNRKYCSHDCYIKARFWCEEDKAVESWPAMALQ